MNYQEYINSDKWKQTRRWILEFWDHRCAICNGCKNIQVHHRNYDRLGHELTTDCLVLCDRCHELHHNFTGNFLTGILDGVMSYEKNLGKD